MAQLETLQIRGIRSFGTGTADEQVKDMISFCFSQIPLQFN